MTSHTPEVGKPDSVVVSPRAAVIGPIAANIAFVIEITLVPLLLPAIQLQFGLSIGELAWVFNSYGIAVAVGVLLGGWCGDAFNTKKVFGYGVAVFAIGSFLVAAADSFGTLIIGRTMQGFGGGIFSPLVPLLLTRASPQKPGKVLIVWGSIAGYVAAFAPLLYGSFLGAHGWNLAFILTATVALIALMILNGSQITDDLAPRPGSTTGYSELFRTRDLWVTFVYVFCTYGSITYYLFQLPVWMSDNEVNWASTGFALSILWLTFSALSALLRNMVDRPDIRPIMFSAPLLIAAGLWLSYYSEILLLLVVSSVLVGSGLACSNAPSTQLILRFAPKGMSAISTSLDITFARLGGIATVAFLVETDFVYAALAIGLLCIVAVFCALKASKGLADSI
ncbi:MFS transporter [Aestuariibius sp. 2305UL40-4]|uniref:MFS transporter n=1 Tax=Aestuariibius violaceus TaxID=3234132 RepID=UPI00345E4D0E